LFFALLCLLSIPFLLTTLRAYTLTPMLPFVLLALWQTALLVLRPAGVAGLQTVLVLWSLVLLALMTAAFTTGVSAEVIRRRLVKAGYILAALFTVALVATRADGSSFIGRRSFALVALILMCAAVPYVGKRNRPAGWLAVLLAVLIAASLSRTALVAAALLLAVRLSISSRGVSRVRLVALFATGVAALLWAIENVPLLRERFTGGDRAFQIGGLTISSQGRDRIWAAALSSWSESPIIGHGPGSVREAINIVIDTQTEPHNDFIRVLHDSGLVGVVLLALSILSLVVAFTRRIRGAASIAHAAPHIAALLATGAFVFGMATDNPIVYIFVVLPYAVVVGLSLREPVPSSPRAGAKLALASRNG
jgi:O-antigen ligase